MVIDETYKLKYIQVYIHHMKQRWVNIKPPQTATQRRMLEQAFQVAMQTMNRQGKKINIH